MKVKMTGRYLPARDKRREECRKGMFGHERPVVISQFELRYDLNMQIIFLQQR